MGFIEADMPAGLHEQQNLISERILRRILESHFTNVGFPLYPWPGWERWWRWRGCRLKERDLTLSKHHHP